MKRLPTHKRLICFLLCLPVILAMALPANAKPVFPDFVNAAPVHYRANSSSAVIGYLPQDTALTILGRQGQYYQIDCYDMVGFIHRDFVDKRDETYYVNLSAFCQDAVQFRKQTIGNTITAQRQLYCYTLEQVGVPYVAGGTSPRGFDCSGFTQYIYRQLGISIPRTCDGQLGSGLIIPKDKLQCGDLVLFQRTTSHKGISTHVGIYLGDGKLIHAGSRGITVVELDSAYFTEHYLCARRIILCEQPKFVIPSALRALNSTE